MKKNIISPKKNIVQDVIPPKKTIRNIDIPDRRKEKFFESNEPQKIKKDIKEEVFEEIPQKEVPDKKFNYKYEYDHPKKSSKKLIYVVLAIFVLAVIFGFSKFWNSAKITINPKKEIVPVENVVFNAKKNGENLGFQVVTVSKTLEEKMVSTEESQVFEKAEGKIVIFNNFSSESQKLVATTRFETSGGLVFRLVDQVTVPGLYLKDGKTIPGSVEVLVRADQAGDKYNIAPSDFTIPGLKGTSKYSKMFAKSKTEMAGGFSGVRKVVSKEVLEATSKKLDEKLKESLMVDIESQIPNDFVLYPSSVSYNLFGLGQKNGGKDEVIISKKATAYGVIFKKNDLTESIRGKILKNYKDEKITITNLGNQTFALKNQSFDPKSSETLEFSLTGQVDFVWVFDEEVIKSDVAGLSKKQFGEFIKSYKFVKDIWLEISPFWNGSIPSDRNKIKVVNQVALEQ